MLMAAASGLTTLGAIPPFLLGAQAVAVRADLGLGLGVFGIAVSVFFGTAALATVFVSGPFDRLGRRWGLALAGGFVALGGGAVAGPVEGWRSLLATMVVLGLGNAACQSTANMLMARALPVGRRGLGFGIKQSAVPLAIMLAGLAVPSVGRLGGWRVTFAILGGLGVLVVLVAVVRGHRWPPLSRAAVVEDASLDVPPTLPLLLAGVGITFASAAANFVGSFVASWGFEVGLTPTQTGVLMAVGAGASIVLRVLSGWRADRRHGANLPVVATQMIVGGLACLGLAVDAAWSVVVFGLLALSIGWAWPGLLLFAVARLGRDHPAQASGVVQAGAFAGGAVGPMLLGALSAAAGFPLTWLVAAGCFGVAGSLILLSRRLFSIDLARRPPREPLS